MFGKNASRLAKTKIRDPSALSNQMRDSALSKINTQMSGGLSLPSPTPTAAGDASRVSAMKDSRMSAMKSSRMSAMKNMAMNAAQDPNISTLSGIMS